MLRCQLHRTASGPLRPRVHTRGFNSYSHNASQSNEIPSASSSVSSLSSTLFDSSAASSSVPVGSKLSAYLSLIPTKAASAKWQFKQEVKHTETSREGTVSHQPLRTQMKSDMKFAVRHRKTFASIPRMMAHQFVSHPSHRFCVCVLLILLGSFCRSEYFDS